MEERKTSFNDLFCIRCGRPATGRYLFDDCPFCREEGVSANYSARIPLPAAVSGSFPVESNQPGIWKYRALYAVSSKVSPVSLEEGDTPLVKLGSLGSLMDLDELYAKDETRNPTWSHKDRLTTVGVTKAKELGYSCIVTSSTGNQGLSAAAYAARAGIPCVIFTGTTSPMSVKTLMRAYGAMVFELSTSRERTTLVEKCVRELGWFPLTGFGESGRKGANPYAIDGYKSMALELVRQCGCVPDQIVFPIAGGDSMVGTWKGFVALKEMKLIGSLPKMIAAEPLGPLEKTIREGSSVPLSVPDRPTVAFAVAGDEGTYQALQTITDSHGAAVSADDEQIMAAQEALARNEGMFVEPSSALALAVVSKMARQGLIRRQDKTVVLLTSSGLKEYESATKRQQPLMRLEPDLNQLKRALITQYGFSI